MIGSLVRATFSERHLHRARAHEKLNWIIPEEISEVCIVAELFTRLISRSDRAMLIFRGVTFGGTDTRLHRRVHNKRREHRGISGYTLSPVLARILYSNTYSGIYYERKGLDSLARYILSFFG